MPSIEKRIDTLERRLARLTEDEMRRFEKLEERMTKAENEGMCELWWQLMETQKRLKVVERSCKPPRSRIARKPRKSRRQ